MKYNIFIFTIYNNETQLMTISQVYCKGRIRAMMALGLITGANDDEIDYISQESTCEPLLWDLELETN